MKKHLMGKESQHSKAKVACCQAVLAVRLNVKSENRIFNSGLWSGKPHPSPQHTSAIWVLAHFRVCSSSPSPAAPAQAPDFCWLPAEEAVPKDGGN